MGEDVRYQLWIIAAVRHGIGSLEWPKLGKGTRGASGEKGRECDRCTDWRGGARWSCRTTASTVPRQSPVGASGLLWNTSHPEHGRSSRPRSVIGPSFMEALRLVSFSLRSLVKSYRVDALAGLSQQFGSIITMEAGDSDYYNLEAPQINNNNRSKTVDIRSVPSPLPLQTDVDRASNGFVVYIISNSPTHKHRPRADYRTVREKPNKE